MQIILSVIGLMILLYFGAGYLDMPHHTRAALAFWGGIILGVLGAIGNALNKTPTKKTGGSPAPQKQVIEQIRPDLSTRTVDGVRVIIRYKDGGDDETERTIRPSLLEYETDAQGTIQIKYIHAYCELRKGPRAFRYDRLQSAYDPDTGEVVSNIGVLLWEHPGKN
ncbi:MAG: WYL domain-containing protein [Acetobacter sp.]|uniref:WYL domain-containing protein n=1 Tax=Acetobacter sp. TaxID=440 RepID=UPI003CFE8924